MELKQKTIRNLYPSEGYMLTQSNEVDEKDRFFSAMVVLAENDDASNYREIPQAEAKEIMARQEAERERQRIEMEKERERRELEARLAELNNETSDSNG